MEDSDETLPSGRWRGFYVHARSQVRHRMDLDLVIARGRIIGKGGDDIGPFLISGRVDEDRRVIWTKSYPGSHDVYYEGHADLNGIWGTWRIEPTNTGGFRIWPAAWGNPEGRTGEEACPVEEGSVAVAAVATGR